MAVALTASKVHPSRDARRVFPRTSRILAVTPGQRWAVVNWLGPARAVSDSCLLAQMSLLDFSNFETTTGGTWRLAGCRDYWSKYELGWHITPTANQHDAIAAVELALTEAERLAGRPLIDLAERDEQGNVVPLLTIVTDNGGPFRSFRFEAFVATHPELRHVRTRVKTPEPNGSRERGFGSLKYEKLFLEEIPDALDLVSHAEDYRVDYNTVRPHEALAWNRPRDVHLGLADPLIPNFPETKDLPAA